MNTLGLNAVCKHPVKWWPVYLLTRELDARVSLLERSGSAKHRNFHGQLSGNNNERMTSVGLKHPILLYIVLLNVLLEFIIIYISPLSPRKLAKSHILA